MRKKKHTFHCQRCGTPCQIYKKGKGHRLLVCPNHGILATNPLPLGMLAAAVAPSLIEKGLDFISPTKKETQSPSYQKIEYVDKYTAQERYADAMR